MSVKRSPSKNTKAETYLAPTLHMLCRKRLYVVGEKSIKKTTSIYRTFLHDI